MKTLENILLSIDDVSVIDGVPITKYVPVDLSVTSVALNAKKFNTANDMETFIKSFAVENNATVAFGGYNERRGLYDRSQLFSGEEEKRDIHIGMDLWIAAGTTVLAALDGIVHSFNFNTGLGNYGPTIILEHYIEGHTFYTLYGHLSIESIENINIGDKYKQGDPLATLGDATVNGDYAPHLHFQIIKNMHNYFGDYPGVSTKNDLAFYLENCPDPNLLLKIHT